MIQAPTMWTSLEITKLLLGALTPLVLVFLGLWVNRIAKRIEAAQWANQKLIEKRIAIFDELAPLINDLYCYYMCVGNWKDLTPPKVVDTKRKLDKKIYVYSSLFSSEFITKYNEFIQLCFQTYAGAGHDAKFKTSIETKGGNRKDSSPIPWESEWDELFTPLEDCPLPKEIREAYNDLMSGFSRELGVGLGQRTEH